MILKFELDVEAISVNKLYCNIPGQARRFVSAEGKKFKTSVRTIVRDKILVENLSKDISKLVGKPLTVFMEVGLPTWFLKDGKTLRRKDLDNTAKASLDALFSTLAEFDEAIDDSQIWELTQTKVVSEYPMVVITIQEMTQ